MDCFSSLAIMFMLMVSLVGPVVGVLGTHSPSLTPFSGAVCLPALEPPQGWWDPRGPSTALLFLCLKHSPPRLPYGSFSHSFRVITQVLSPGGQIFISTCPNLHELNSTLVCIRKSHPFLQADTVPCQGAMTSLWRVGRISDSTYPLSWVPTCRAQAVHSGPVQMSLQ